MLTRLDHKYDFRLFLKLLSYSIIYCRVNGLLFQKFYFIQYLITQVLERHAYSIMKFLNHQFKHLLLN